MRTKDEINQEYSQCCVSYGDKNNRKRALLKEVSKIEVEMTKLQDRCDELMVEVPKDLQPITQQAQSA